MLACGKNRAPNVSPTRAETPTSAVSAAPPASPGSTPYGDFRYRTFTIYWQRGDEERAYEVRASDTLSSRVAREAYPELAR